MGERGLGILIEKDASTWISPDGTTTLSKTGGRWTLSLPDGGSIDLGSEFKEGDYSLRRLKIAESNPAKSIVGDFAPKEPLDVDANGNYEVTENAAPGRDDVLSGSLGSDSIKGEGGQDVLHGDRAANRDGGDDSNAQDKGSADRMEGGDGSDIVAGQEIGRAHV